MRLEIYVAAHCETCVEALRIAELAKEVAGVEVAVVDLGEAGRSAPPRVVAVPTYLLDGRVVALGNPYRDEFLAQLRRRARESVP